MSDPATPAAEAGNARGSKAGRIVLQVLAAIGGLMAAVAGLSGVALYLLGGNRAAFNDPIIIWFAPLFLTPLALIGAAFVAIASLVSRQKRALFGVSCLALIALLAATAASFMLTGLASGEVAPESSPWGTIATVVSLLYAASMVVVGAVGVIVAREIGRRGIGVAGQDPSAPAASSSRGSGDPV